MKRFAVSLRERQTEAFLPVRHKTWRRQAELDAANLKELGYGE
jgi:hypothetical protein